MGGVGGVGGSGTASAKGKEERCRRGTSGETAAASRRKTHDTHNQPPRARHEAPRDVVFGPLPKTSTGKVQKFTLRVRAKELAANGGAPAARSFSTAAAAAAPVATEDEASVDDALLLVERDAAAPGVLTLTLNRPRARNALSTGLMAALTLELQKAAAAPADAADAPRVIVLRGAGVAFSAGHDLAEVRRPNQSAPSFRVVTGVGLVRVVTGGWPYARNGAHKANLLSQLQVSWEP